MIDDISQVEAGDGGTAEIGLIGGSQMGQLFTIFADIVVRGEGFPQQPPLTRSVFDEVWVRPVTLVAGATRQGALVGAYYLKPNLPGMGSHIANAGYVVDRRYRGLGFGRLLVEDSISRAPLAGFDAIQFNFVFADNPARALYEGLGWQVVGKVPDGIAPGRDAIIYWRAVP
ncbi:MAG: GNAT family N-acetyltransferase [Acidimicrobiales bacterium]|jgi:GNAT superfamily N-acetyltransferase